MSRRKRNKGNKRVKKYNSFHNHNKYVGPQSYIKLYLNKNFENILKMILEKSKDPIAERFLSDSKKSHILTRVSWLNITESNDHLSYASPFDVKKTEDGWKKENRNPIQIRKLIRKIYKKTFSNNQIKTFSSKFKMAYSQYTKGYRENITRTTLALTRKPSKLDNERILLNLMVETDNGNIKWVKKNEEYFDKFETKISVTDKKYLLVTLFYIERTKKNFITIYFINDNDKIYIDNISDNNNSVSELKKIINNEF